MKTIWEKPVSHGEILKRIWKNLDLGTLQRKHPFHLPVFGTICDREPSLRIVVLEDFGADRRRSRFIRISARRRSIRLDRIRMSIGCFITRKINSKSASKAKRQFTPTTNLAEEQWLATELFSRRCYVGKPPTQESKKPTSGLPDDLEDREPTAEESEEGRANFVVITSTIDEIDCLELAVKGHRRSLFKWHDNGELETKWLTP